jgi:PAS domain S-box-containing protein
MSHQPPQPNADLLAHEGEHAYEQMFRANPHAMWVYDVETLRFLDVNAAAVTLYGYTRDEFLSMTIAGIRAPEDVPAMQEQVRHVQALSTVAQSGPWRHRDRSGKLLLVEASSHGLRYAGRPARLVHAVEVSERVRLEQERARASQALQESRERLRRALDSGSVALWERDLRTGELLGEGRWAEMMGSTPERFGPMTPQVFEQRCHPDDLPSVIAHLRSLAANPLRSGEQEFRLRRDDGSWVWVLSRGQVSAFDDAGRSARLAGTLIDISELKLAQEAREAQAAALQASAMKSQFIGRASHELRTPLNAVLGFAHLLQTDTQQPLSERQRARVGRIADAGQHLLRLISDLIDLSSIEAGMLTLRLAPVDAMALLGECLAMVEPQLQQEGLHVERERAEGLPRVRADALRLKQVLLNLLSNAIKYNRAEGWVRIEAAARDVELELSVTNSGQGLNAGELAGLFEPFNRLGQEAGSREGSGIGLAITRQLVEHMGGCIAASSEPGAWTRFVMRLPLA